MRKVVLWQCKRSNGWQLELAMVWGQVIVIQAPSGILGGF